MTSFGTAGIFCFTLTDTGGKRNQLRSGFSRGRLDSNLQSPKKVDKSNLPKIVINYLFSTFLCIFLGLLVGHCRTVFLYLLEGYLSEFYE